MTRSQSALLAAGFLGASGVATGALGAHALAATLTARDTRTVWETAVHFHLFHAVALVGLAGWLRSGEGGAAGKRAGWAVRCWTVGTILFSGSLYALAFGVAPRWVGPVTPLGGLFLLAGWIFAAAAAVAPHEG
jgi:uncharacterized membrane protein YgdD (TMEM256/DUF423 family)